MIAGVNKTLSEREKTESGVWYGDIEIIN